MSENYPKGQQIRDLKVMIEADRAHLGKALDDGNYRAADRFMDSVKNLRAELAQLIGG
jgi:hypothetical protein